MYTMKQTCDRLGISYETLRFYCDEGLVPNVKRKRNNYRDFDEKNLKWLESLLCLKHCGMCIHDMKKYMNLCLQGQATIPQRKEMLAHQKRILTEKIAEIQSSIHFIDDKQQFYDDVTAGRTAYTSNIIDTD